MDDDYELMPHKAVEKLKKEIEYLRKKASPSSPEIQKSIENLNKSVNDIKILFEQAAEDISKEEAAEEEIIGKLEPIQQRVNEIEDENIKIAQAILAIAEMIKERIPEKVVLPEFKKPMPTPTFRQAPPVKPLEKKHPISQTIPSKPQEMPPMGPPKLPGMPPPIGLPPKEDEIPKPIESLGPPIRAPSLEPLGMPPPIGLPPKPPEVPSPLGAPIHPSLGPPPKLQEMPPPIRAPSPAPMPPGPMPTPLEPKKKGFFAKLLGK